MEYTNTRTRIIIFWVIVFIIVGFFGWKFVPHKTQSLENSDQLATTTESVPVVEGSKTSTPVIDGEVIPGTNVIISQAKPQKVSVPMPSLERSFTPSSSLDAGMVSRITADMNIRIENLKKNKTSFKDWIDLGFDRKVLGDYVGAREAWEYVSLLYPQNQISFGNLGDLYVNFLPDLGKAEVAYTQAIKNESTNVDMYKNLYELYVKESNNTEAEAILKKGISYNKTDLTLVVTLARFYRNTANKTSSEMYYNQAIVLAQKQNNTTAVDSLKTELADLK